jgi:hypothetical protein
VRQSEPDSAIEVLLEGSRQFRAHFHRPQAIHLLRRARTIDPWHFETVLELALHLGRADQQAEASLLLEGLAERCQERQLRRVRAAALAVAPGARSLVRWLTSWRGREERLLELPAQTAASRSAPVLTLASEPAPVRRRDARVVAPVPEPEDDRSSAAF